VGYLGSKAASGAFQAIIASMPPHDTYIETHLGGGAIMLRKPKVARSIGIDIDQAALDLNEYQGVDLHCGDAVAFLQSFDFASAGRVLIYSDPPYVAATRTSRNRYAHEYTDNDHINLLNELKRCQKEGAMVMVSGYPSALYEKHLDWRNIEFQVMTRGGVRTEKLWFSFEKGQVNWSAYAGENFTDRQRIKRKAEGWAKKYQALPEMEQIAILSELLKQEGTT
jgi:site-specific DNA-adenine methylase